MSHDPLTNSVQISITYFFFCTIADTNSSSLYDKVKKHKANDDSNCVSEHAKQSLFGYLYFIILFWPVQQNFYNFFFVSSIVVKP